MKVNAIANKIGWRKWIILWTILVQRRHINNSAAANPRSPRRPLYAADIIFPPASHRVYALSSVASKSQCQATI
jgi:hypothetical protein